MSSGKRYSCQVLFSYILVHSFHGSKLRSLHLGALAQGHFGSIMSVIAVFSPAKSNPQRHCQVNSLHFDCSEKTIQSYSS